MEPLFTIITDVFYKKNIFEKTIFSILNQTYKNTEIIVANNGANESISEFLNQLSLDNENLKIINYKKNIYSFKDPELRTYIICNDLLKCASGEFIFYTSYDDPLALDYVERMVRLFKNNPNCSSAAGRPVSIDINDKVNLKELNSRASNYRDTYMSGKVLALETLKGKTKLFASPGTIFTFKTEDLIKAGGYHRAVEWSQLYGIVPFGETGFDDNAIYYWRRHADQMNHELTRIGWTAFKEHISLIKEYEIYKKWSVFDKTIASFVVNKLINNRCEITSKTAIINLFHFRLGAFFKNIKEAYKYYYFWTMLFKNLVLFTPILFFRFFISRIIEILKFSIRFIDIKLPNIKNKSKFIMELTIKANK
jgi:glycosyltransferase involved in cell wall biosynthesis